MRSGALIVACVARMKSAVGSSLALSSEVQMHWVILWIERLRMRATPCWHAWSLDTDNGGLPLARPT